jgi:peptide/nickel transport system permease protein
MAALNKAWGLNKPIFVQYALYVARLVHGNLGTSLFYQLPVTQLLLGRLPCTLFLMAVSVVLALAIALPIATLAAVQKGGIADQVLRLVCQLGLGVPVVWTGIMLALLLALKLSLFPVAGYGTGWVSHLHSLFLPSLTVALGMFPTMARSLRASLIDVLDSDYIAAARARGLSTWRVLVRHGLRNAIAPTVTVVGLNVGYLVGSTLAIETIFGLPGLGSLLIAAVLSRDFPVVQGVAIVYGVLVMLVNLGTDLVHTSLDPRLVME